MDIYDYFKATPNISTEEVKTLLKEGGRERVSLVDVRQPGEYEEEHIPGAHLIPLGELEKRLGELDRTKMKVVYCASGRRSSAAVQTLLREGFSNVFRMDGGIKAWKGHVATGLPETGMAYFSPAARREDYIILSWNLEKGTRTFYERISATIDDPKAARTLRELVVAEEKHQMTLRELFERSSKSPFDPSEITGGRSGEVMEGGMDVTDAIEWANGKNLEEILEFSMSLEANAYDRYALMSRTVKDDGSREVFTVLSKEEKGHLDNLTVLFEGMIAK